MSKNTFEEAIDWIMGASHYGSWEPTGDEAEKEEKERDAVIVLFKAYRNALERYGKHGHKSFCVMNENSVIKLMSERKCHCGADEKNAAVKKVLG